MNVPPRPDQVPGTPSPGAIAPGQAGVVIARVVIIFGTTGGIFIYNGTPAKGTLVGSIVANGGTDFYGNTYGEGFNLGTWSATTGLQEQHLGIDLTGNLYLANASGVTTIYANPALDILQVFSSSGEGAGNQVGSIASAATTDPNGNIIPSAGFTSYGPAGSGSIAAALASGGVQFWFSATGQLGSYTAEASVVSNANGVDLLLTAPNGVVGVETNMVLENNFVIANQHPGSTFPVADQWHTVSLSPGPAWTASPGQYLFVPLGVAGTGSAWLNGKFTAGTTFADGTVIGSVAASWAPATSQNIPVTTNNMLATAGDQSPHFVVETSGNIECFGIRAAGDVIGVNAIYPLG